MPPKKRRNCKKTEESAAASSSSAADVEPPKSKNDTSSANEQEEESGAAASSLASTSKKEGEEDYYKLLDLARNCSEDDIKKAYRKKALEWHPDKNPGNEQATEMFKLISKAYKVLVDPMERAYYDKHGSTLGVDNIDSLSPEEQLQAYIRLFQSSRLDTADINAYMARQQQEREQSTSGVSKDEAADLTTYYNKYKGDIKKIMSCVIGEDEDRPRFVKYLADQIKVGALELHPAFKKCMPKEEEQSSEDTRKDTSAKPKAKNAKKLQSQSAAASTSTSCTSKKRKRNCE